MDNRNTLIIFFVLMFCVSLSATFVFADSGSYSARTYWFNGIEGLSDLTLTGTGTMSLDTNKMYGNYSLRATSLGYGAILGTSVPSPFIVPYENYTDATQCTTLGIWIYFNSTSSCPSYIINWVMSNNDGTNQTQVGFTNKVSGGIYDIQLFYMDSATPFWYYDTTIPTSSLIGSWHWFEVSIYSDGTRNYPSDKPTFVYYIDGISYGLMYGTGASHSVKLTVFKSFMSYTYITTSGYVNYDYLRFYQGEEYPPSYPPSNSGFGQPTVNITDLPTKLGIRLNISSFLAGLLISLALFLFVEIPLLIFASDSLFMQAVAGLGTLGLSTVLGWLPVFTYVLVTIIVVLLFVDVIRHRVWF